MGMVARRPVRLVVAAVVLASAGVVGSTSAAWARSGVDIDVKDAQLSPTEVAAGEDVTVASVGPGCLHGSGERVGLVWAVFPHGDFAWGEQTGWQPDDAIASGEGFPQQSALPGGQFGAWSVTFAAPDLGEPPSGGEIGPGSPVTEAVLQAYGPLTFTVDGEHQLDFVAKCYTTPDGPGDLQIAPEVPELGRSATVTALDPCPMPHTQGGSVTVELWDRDVNSTGTELNVTPLPAPDLAEDGSWSVTFEMPDKPDHVFAINAHCTNVEGGTTLGYWIFAFDAHESGGPPIETPPEMWDDVRTPSDEPHSAQPAQPVPGEPNFTG